MIGIDLGTTNSLVAVMQDGNPKVLANELGDFLTPSIVAAASDGEILVGRAAKDRIVTDPTSGVSCFKRDIGTHTHYKIGGKNWSPTECSAVVLRELKRIAENHLGTEVTEAVISVPAYFGDAQRKATKEAGEMAGLTVRRLVNEPTAAALAYGYRASDEEKNIFVFDLGGGTFDVTLLEIFDGIIEVKASGGVSRLGGEDYTDALAEWAIEKAGDQPNDKLRLRWRQQVEVAKRRLTQQEEVTVSVQGNEIKISRDDFEEAGKELTARIRPVIKRCLRDANMDEGELDDVLLVGGASRMPLITGLAANSLSRIPNSSHDPDQVVVIGAAVQAALVDGDEAVADIVLTDVCSHTLGISTTREISPGRFEDGYFSPIIDRNTTVPVSRSGVYSTNHPTQDEVLIQVYQGEGRKVHDNRKIGEVKVVGLRHRSGQQNPGEVEIRFTYDMNGLLEVEATVMETQKRVSRVFQQQSGSLSKEQIEATLQRLAPLKMHPRDKLPNRARIERSDRLFEELIGPARDHLSLLVANFETALESQDAEQINISAAVLDSFMNPHYSEEGEQKS